MKSWNKIRLGDACQTNFDTYSLKDDWSFVNYLDTSNIVDNKIDEIQFIDVTKEELPSRARRKVKYNSIIYSTVRPDQRHFGIIKSQPDNFLVSTGFAVIDVDPTILDADFLYYKLSQNSIVETLHSIATQSTSAYPAIKPSDLENLELEIPNIETQAKIGKFLRNLDDKIRHNTAINDNLYKQLELLFNYWFTQFDFPDSFRKPYKASGGTLIYNDSIKRDIPNSWKVSSLGELCSFRNGINYDKNSTGSNCYRIINVRNITASTIIINEDDCDTISLLPSHANKYVVSDDDIIIARSGTPGATRLLLNPSGHVIFCGFIICCTPNNHIMRNYLWCWLKQFEGTSSTRTGGSILQNVSQDTLKSLPVVIPPEDVLLAFNKQMDCIIKAIDNNMRASNQLLRYRDWLLPMLMSGQATISN